MNQENNNGDPEVSLFKRAKRMVFGASRKATDPQVFHKVSLVAFLAWIGLGADGISSACYGPEEAFRALGEHQALAILLAVMTAATVFIISASYMQVIELFPTGGGGYLVASKLLTPKLGLVSGCALLVDYVLTIAISIASGADALFSFMPAGWLQYKVPVASVVLLVLIVMNLRGVKESVVPIVPIFLVFLLTHGAVILWAVFSHALEFPTVVSNTINDFSSSAGQIGVLGVGLLLLHAYSLGGGTYTGIEAVSNGLNVLREPRVQTGKRTMIYMAISLAVTAGGLIVAYLLFSVKPQSGKTLNAVLFEQVAGGWPGGRAFIMITLASEMMILLVAAQTGFLGGPAVLSNMALDGWMPTRFSLLSDRLVTENGVLLMGGASLLLIWASKGSVAFLVVLYSINVFLTFSLAQLGMVKHWWQNRATEIRWRRKITVNGVGLFLTSFILVTVSVVKFHEGGWVTILITGSLVVVALLIKRHYLRVRELLKRLDTLLVDAVPPSLAHTTAKPPALDASPKERTAVILVNGFGGLGLHALFGVQRIFRGHFKNFVFIQVGMIDAGQFKGVQEIQHLERTVVESLDRYVEFMRGHGYHAARFHALGTDVVEEVEKLAVLVSEHYPNSVLFASQLVFPRETIFTQILHNYTAFAIQKRLYQRGMPLIVLPIRV
jgi:amino acid transporter